MSKTVGAALSGGIAGAAITSGAAAGVVGGFIGDIVDQGVQIFSGDKNSYSAKDAAINTVLGGGAGKLAEKISILPGVLKAESGLAQKIAVKQQEKAIMNSAKSGWTASKANTPIQRQQAKILGELSASQANVSKKMSNLSDGAKAFGATISAAVDQSASAYATSAVESVGKGGD